MGLLVDGKWLDQWYDTESNDGEFKRESATFRQRLGSSDFPAEAGRYHLYVSLACPWAHRCLILRSLKQLSSAVSVSRVSPLMLSRGWSFDRASGSDGDPLYDAEYLSDIYVRENSTYTGRVTVPVLWDKVAHRLVNNESADIVRIFNRDFSGVAGNGLDFYPEALRSEIDHVNKRVYDTVNNGVYRCGFATEQAAYEHAFDALFESLDWLESRLQSHRFLVDSRLSEADWRLFTTLVRFDAVYVGHFKCNRHTLSEFPALSNYLRELYQWPGVAETVNMRHIKQHYYRSHPQINPTAIVPKGPALALDAAHNRHSLSGYDANGTKL